MSEGLWWACGGLWWWALVVGFGIFVVGFAGGFRDGKVGGRRRADSSKRQPLAEHFPSLAFLPNPNPGGRPNANLLQSISLSSQILTHVCVCVYYVSYVSYVSYVLRLCSVYVYV